MRQNEKVYGSREVVEDYARQSHLQPAEETIFSELRPWLRTAAMLDLGVGGGRTTLHFANCVREYVGVDYSESMIRECQQRFAGHSAHVSFKVCDARSMKVFRDGSFDFILFSHNGIDYVAHEDRLQMLKEIRRVGKAGGVFCFSTHNLNWCANLFEWRRAVSFNPRLAAHTARRLVLRCVYNWGLRAVTVRQASHLVINCSLYRHKQPTYFIRPLEQIAQLGGHFTGIRGFSGITGAEIKEPSELQRIEDPWLYFLCAIKQADG